VVYAAIPLSGLVFLLFVVERLLFGPQAAEEEQQEIQRAVEQAEREERSQAASE
jgi:hypothetical protein